MNKPPKKDDWISRAQARDKWFPLTMLGVATAGVVARTTNTVEFSLDFVTFCAFIALIAWLLWPSKKDSADQ